ncbi:response regulator transcription factor [Vibrio brasiliensis]|jgi:DNA-binding response OmpR family regulator|uniref:response regulator transcription factor n=1 Tax=Vibrio brasiliensis TaxID=170652 RepID=UPI001EFD5DD4|nr:response regulator transcription factor [Vibrio brasiliensis]MCG9751709.1 response regulator transcription factor [Vibrio brasiliensis]MCG9782460.1 response regulator transcription factor [Vibrio brasiliensis]
MSRILLIEDDQLVGEGFSQYLTEEGFECQWLSDSKNVEKHWIQADLVILDRQLPEGDSLAWLPRWLMIKAIPVIVLTAKVDVEQRIEGLMAGAKDYVVKPFSHQELLARIHAQLRPLGDSKLCYKNLQIDLSKRIITSDGKELSLKPKEFQLLLLLVQNQGRAFHRDELLNKVWGFQAFPSTRTVDNHILHLRQKLPTLDIETIHGVGYRLSEE